MLLLSIEAFLRDLLDIKVRRLQGSAAALTGGVRFMPDGRTAIAGSGQAGSRSSDNSLRLWDIEMGVELGCFTGHSKPLSSIAPCPNGHTALSASVDGTVRRWDFSVALKTGLSTAIEQVDTERHNSEIIHDVRPQTVQAIAVHPDGRTALIGLGTGQASAPDHSLRLIDVATGREVRRLKGHTDPVEAVSISPNGRQALSGSVDGTVLLWDLETGQVIRRLEGHTGGVRSTAFSPQGRLVVTGSRDESVIVWDSDTGEAVRRYLGHRGEVVGVCMAREGRTVISAGADLTVREWRIDATRQELQDWIRNNRYVSTLTPEERKQYDVDLIDASLHTPQEQNDAPNPQ